MSELFETYVPSPLGRLRLLASETALVGVYFPGHRGAPAPAAARTTENAVLAQAAAELGQYFRGERLTFSTPMAAAGTAFQQAVWRALRDIPFGEQRSYAALAQQIGRPRAVRAVGTANARNPLSIFVPCHRVVGKGGALTGYAGGTAAKAWLLAHERARPGPKLTAGARAAPAP